ncbi:MAG: hypothetical protein AAF251_12430 [Pseudomonadota bacterium]
MTLAEPGKLLILTGASGAGKTTIANRVEDLAGDRVQVFRFDSIGVPSPEEMNAQFGSGEGWQRAMTHQWIERLQSTLGEGTDVLFEGQMKPAFVDEALRKNDIESVECWLVDCGDLARRDRLANERQQPELANQNMMNWARYLREEARAMGVTWLDTDALSCKEAANQILAFFKPDQDG